MTDRQLLQQALDALEGSTEKTLSIRAMKALRERLAHCDRCGKKLGGEGDIHTCTPDPIGDAQDRLIAEMSAQPAQQELVGREAYMAIREARENASEDAYFAARPEHDKDLNRLMFRSGFYRGYPNTPPAAQRWAGKTDDGKILVNPPAAAQHQWVGLTDEEIEGAVLGWHSTEFSELEDEPSLIDIGRAIEAKLKEKNT